MGDITFIISYTVSDRKEVWVRAEHISSVVETRGGTCQILFENGGTVQVEDSLKTFTDKMMKVYRQ